PVAEDLSSASVPFEDLFEELLMNLSSLLHDHAGDLFDEFASDAEKAHDIFISSITLHDCMSCKASRIRFEPHVYMEGLHPNFELWEALQGLLGRIDQHSNTEETLTSYCQVRTY